MSKVKLLLYCTKAKPYLYGHYIGFETFYHYDLTNDRKVFDMYKVLNGKIIAECDCDKVEKWVWNKWWNYYAKNTDSEIQNIDDEDIEKSCLTFGYLYDYLFENDGYALHLSNVNIFDKPKELNNFCFLSKFVPYYLVERAPQNMCRIYDKEGNMYILISIRPEWLCKILNGEKTIEVRKQIVKELKELMKDE